LEAKVELFIFDILSCQLETQLQKHGRLKTEPLINKVFEQIKVVENVIDVVSSIESLTFRIEFLLTKYKFYECLYK